MGWVPFLLLLSGVLALGLWALWISYQVYRLEDRLGRLEAGVPPEYRPWSLPAPALDRPAEHLPSEEKQ